MPRHKRVVIDDQQRAEHTDIGAFKMAVKEIREEYKRFLELKSQNVKLHLVLAVEDLDEPNG